VTGGVAALSIALLLGGLPLAYLGRHVAPAGLWNFPDVFEELTFVAVPVVGFVLVSRRPANKIGWILLATGLLLGLGFFGQGYGWYGLIAARPRPVPGARAAEWLVNWIWIVPAGAFAFVLLLFPDGLLPSRRWRPAAWFVAAVYALDTMGFVARASRVWRDPFGPQSQGWYPGLHSVLVVLWPAATVVAAAALITRFAWSSGEERLQLKWFAAAAALVVVTIIPLAEAPQISSRPDIGVPLVAPLKVLFCLALVCLWVAIAVAILKYRLYEIDIVISKALQYGTLAVCISAVYAGLVAGVGTLAGDRRSPLLSAIAAIVVAVAFHPVQLRPRGLRTGSCTAGGPALIKCFPSSRGASAAATHATCWPRWLPLWPQEPVPSVWSSGCASDRNCAPRPLQTAVRRNPSRWTATSCRRCRTPTSPPQSCIKASCSAPSPSGCHETSR
jgi:two-component system, NarL family, sensor kinase